MSRIDIENLSVNRGGIPVYSGFSLSFEENSVTAILGSSGSGKTTLLDCIAGLLRPDSGRITGTGGGYLFQEHRLLNWYRVMKNITLPLENLMEPDEARKRGGFFLDLVGLGSKGNRYPFELSGGERQRAAIARAFAFPSRLLLMDEAFQSQDVTLKTQLMKLLRELLAQEPRTVISVTHDVYEALFLAQRIIVIGGRPVSVRLDRKNPGAGNGRTEVSIPLEQEIYRALAFEDGHF